MTREQKPGEAEVGANPFEALRAAAGPPKSIEDDLSEIANMLDWIRSLPTERSGLDAETREELGYAYEIVVNAIWSLPEGEKTP